MLLGALPFLASCTRDVASGLDEAEANRGVVALARAGIDAEKEPDPVSEGRYRLLVGRDDSASAIAVLSAEELPRMRPSTGSPKEGALLPSAETERAQRVAATAAQIERTLGSVDGVLDARVHLDVPTPDPMASLAGTVATNKATASVLLRHRGRSAPLSTEEVKRLVAGAVSGLSTKDVSVVLVDVPSASSTERDTARLGPLTVTRGSLSTARVVLGSALGLVLALAASLVVLVLRMRRLSSTLDLEREGKAEKRVTS